jgi:hypothetical protein
MEVWLVVEWNHEGADTIIAICATPDLAEGIRQSGPRYQQDGWTAAGAGSPIWEVKAHAVLSSLAAFEESR